jgi:hypothetical protein
MNEIVDILNQQAVKNTQDKVLDLAFRNTIADQLRDYDFHAMHKNEFATMIINECINVIRDKVSTDVVDQIKHHFGIQ